VGPLAAQVQHLCLAREQIGAASIVLEGRVEDGEGLVVVAATLMNSTDPDGRGGALLGVLEEFLVLLERLYVVAAAEAFARIFERRLGRDRSSNGDEQKGGGDGANHANSP